MKTRISLRKQMTRPFCSLQFENPSARYLAPPIPSSHSYGLFGNKNKNWNFSIFGIKSMLRKMVHIKCRGTFYPKTNNRVKRFPVPDDKVDWAVNWPEYFPTNYTVGSLLGQPWADPDIKDDAFKPNWNAVDGRINRQSFMGDYEIQDGRPRNPQGRTGLQERGCLGRWGPNHAADPVVTRWLREDQGAIIKHAESQKPILQFVAIERKDSGEWAIPGGMVDAGEKVTATFQREFLEEALNILEANEKQKKDIENMVKSFFEKGTEVYRGYVDDPRNTDNAWMETTVMNFHDEQGDQVGTLPLNAGDDAKGVQWTNMSSDLKLYASHSDFIEKVAKLHDAHW